MSSRTVPPILREGPERHADELHPKPLREGPASITIMGNVHFKSLERASYDQIQFWVMVLMLARGEEAALLLAGNGKGSILYVYSAVQS